MSYVVCMIALGICVYTAVAGKRQYAQFATLKKSADRLQVYRRWAIEPWFTFGLFSVLALILLGKVEFLVQPIIHISLTDIIPDFIRNGSHALAGFAVGAIAGVAVLIFRTLYSARKTGNKQAIGVGNFDALLPQNAHERKYGAGLAVAAGINEELFFRAALPVILVGLFDHAALAVVLSSIIFALGHLYQGWKGVLATGLLGGLLTLLFVLTGSIMVPIAFHIFVDLLSIVIVPSLTERATRRAT